MSKYDESKFKRGNSQAGIKYNETYHTSNLFTGVWDLNQENLTAYDPFISGYAFIIWTKLPIFMLYAEDPEIGTKFRVLTERNFKSFSGIGNINLEVGDLTAGFAGNAYGVATNIQKENTSFSLTHYELTGSPVRQLYTYWVTGIRDMETGLATYHGLLNGTHARSSEFLSAHKEGYSQKNHTGELLYVVTDPSGSANGIEFACYYTNVIPTGIPQDHLAYTAGDHGVHELTMEFRGNYHMGEHINELAKAAMEQYQIKQVFGDFAVNQPGQGGMPSNNGFIGFDEPDFNKTHGDDRFYNGKGADDDRDYKSW